MTVAAQGFRFGIVNNALQVPFLLKAHDPSLFPNDAFVATLDNYFSLIWWLLARVPGDPSWPVVFLVLQIAARYLMLVALFMWMRIPDRDARTALAITLLLAVSQTLTRVSPVGRHGLLLNYFEHTAVANALLLIALAWAVRGRDLRAFVLMGLTFDVNAFVGAWGLAILSLVWLRHFGSGDRPRTALRFGTYVGAALIAAAPALIWLGGTLTRGSAEPFPGDYRAFLKEYFPYHFFITAAPRADVAMLSLLLLASGLALYVARFRERAVLAAYMAATALVFCAGIILPAITGSQPLLNLHLLRVDGVLVLLVAIAVGWAVLFALTETDAEPSATPLSLVALVGLALGNPLVMVSSLALLVTRFESPNLKRGLLAGAAIVASIAIVVAAGGELTARSPDRGATAIALALIGVSLVAAQLPAAAPLALLTVTSRMAHVNLAVLALVAMIPSAVRYRPDRDRVVSTLGALLTLGACAVALLRTDATWTRVWVVAAALIAIAQLLLGYLRPGGRPVRPVPHRALVLVLFACFVAAGAVDRVRAGRLFHIEPLASDEWRAVQEWARVNTSPSVVFAVPPKRFGFETYAHRSVYVDWKHGAAAMWAPGFYRTWRARTDSQVSATDPVRFAESSGTCYAVVDRDDPRALMPRIDLLHSGLPVAYQNRRFVVLRLCSSLSSQASDVRTHI